MTKKSIVTIIPARGGSKGIFKKNLVEIGGKPMIAHTIEAVSNSSFSENCFVSTDDMEIAQVSRDYGGNVPYMRSKSLATDTASINDVVKEMIMRLNVVSDYILLLQPTSPLRSSNDINKAVNLAYNMNANSVVSLAVMNTYHPWTMYYLEENVRPLGSVQHDVPRQQYPKVGWRNGAIYIVKTDVFLKRMTFVTDDFVPYVMPAKRSVNIDTDADLALARYYLEMDRVRI